jgi:hypothetical protein
MRYALLLLFAALTGCSYWQDPGQAEGKAVSMSGVRPGYGRIESVGVLPGARRGAAAAGGGSNRPDPNAYRLSLHMSSGGFQTVDVDNGTFMAGEEVEITPDGRVLRISGTTLNR